MKVRISKAYTGQKHVGWKKTVGGREWYLASGTTPAAERRAIAIATALEAKWTLVKLTGGDCLTVTDLQEAQELADGQPRWSSARSAVNLAPRPLSQPLTGTDGHPRPIDAAEVTGLASPAVPATRRWLYAAMDEVIAHKRRTLKPDESNADDVLNTIDRIKRSRDAVPDVPLDQLRRKELDEWLLGVRQLRSKLTGRPLSPTTIRNIVSGVRVTLSTAAQWEWWTPPPLWEEAFKPYSIKRLQSPTERKARKKRPACMSVHELRVLWRLAMIPLDKALLAIAFWAGHTQNEIATLMLDHLVEEDGHLFIERGRHKTGVLGRWWLPPEAALVVRAVVARTPKDPADNPKGLAILIDGKPLVYRRTFGKRSRIDTVRGRWTALLRAAAHYGVRPIPFKNLRKGGAQLIRDIAGKEVSRTFLAHADEDVQDESYTRPNHERVVQVVQELYPHLAAMFRPIGTGEWDELTDEIRQQPGDRVLPADLTRQHERRQ